MFVAILLSQFNPCPWVHIATDDVITITITDDVIHKICTDLEGKLMCCKKVTCFMTINSTFQIYFLELQSMEILMQ